jgi:hypothetical protein
MARGDYERAGLEAVTPPEREACEGCSMDSSRIRWKLKNAKRPFARGWWDAAMHIWGLRHSEKYAARLGINIKYDFHTGRRLGPWDSGRIGWCAPEGSGGKCEEGSLLTGPVPRMDGRELRDFLENVRWMRVKPLCAMRKLGLAGKVEP